MTSPQCDWTVEGENVRFPRIQFRGIPRAHRAEISINKLKKDRDVDLDLGAIAAAKKNGGEPVPEPDLPPDPGPVHRWWDILPGTPAFEIRRLEEERKAKAALRLVEKILPGSVIVPEDDETAEFVSDEEFPDNGTEVEESADLDAPEDGPKEPKDMLSDNRE